MNKKIIVQRKDKEQVTLEVKRLDESYIKDIMALQEEILAGLEDKSLYAPTDQEEFIEYMNTTGIIIGCTTPENELVAMGVYVKKGHNAGNYGYDLDLAEDELLKVGQIESTVVKSTYRGNGLQVMLCKELEEIAKENGTPIVCATASPDNDFSVNSFIKLGYEIKKEKLKYGGLRRYILMKELKGHF